MNSQLSVGSDAEVALVDTNGFPMSAEGLLGGSKKHPRKTLNGAVQEDNVLAEFNVNPATTVEEFVRNTNLVLADLRDLIRPLDLSISIVAAAEYDPQQLRTKQARRAGCDPDYNAWAVGSSGRPDRNTPPSFVGRTLRSCGGHLHTSAPEAETDPHFPWKMVRVLDLVAGVPSVIMDRDARRRELYGKAGAHRAKSTRFDDPYNGVEYRTLSSFWLKTDELIAWAFNAVKFAYENLSEGLEIANAEEDRILQAINNNCLDTAEQLVKDYSLEVVNV